MTNKMKPAKRVQNLPPYIFKEIDDRKNLLIKRNVPLFNFGIGDPDMQTPDFVVEELCKQAGKNENQKYPSYNGSDAFRQAVCQYMHKRFNIELDYNTQATSLIGTKEGLAHFSWAFLEPGDVALVPNPGFPVYANSARFSGAEVHYMPLLEENHFLPNLDEIPQDIIQKTKVMFLNYPNNPTGAVAKKEDIQKIVDWALKHEIILVSDAAYAELVYHDKNRISFLNAENAHKCVIEFHSFSKTFNMTGFRLGFAVGNTQLIDGLVQLKTNIDSGVFDAIQLAGIKALENLTTSASNLMAEYKKRKDLLKSVLEDAGIKCLEPEGAFYLMAKCPEGVTSMQYTIDLMEKCGIITTPCTGFGTHGEGYIRFALTQTTEIIESLKNQLKKLN